MSDFKETKYGFGEEPKEETQVMRVEDGGKNYIVDLTSAQQSFCSVKATDVLQQAVLYKAMNNPDNRLSDCINMVILAKDLYVEVVECINESTGEKDIVPRIVIIDDEGKGYQAVSVGIFSALKKLIQTYG